MTRSFIMPASIVIFAFVIRPWPSVSTASLDFMDVDQVGYWSIANNAFVTSANGASIVIVELLKSLMRKGYPLPQLLILTLALAP